MRSTSSGIVQVRLKGTPKGTPADVFVLFWAAALHVCDTRKKYSLLGLHRFRFQVSQTRAAR